MDKKIKVLFAIDRMNIGGAPTVVFEQMRAIDKSKFDPFLLTLYPSKQANYFSQIDFIPQDNIKQFKLYKRSLFDLVTWFKVIKYLKKCRFDIVYTHLFLTNIIIRTSAWLMRVPVIVSTEHSTYFNKNKWQILVDRCLAKVTSGIVVAKREIAEFTSRQEKISIDKFKVILNPIVLPEKDEEVISKLRTRYKITSDTFIIITLGRFQEEKGQIYLIKAIEKLKHLPIKCIIVGHGPLKNKLQGEIENRKLQNKCEIIVEPTKAKLFYYLGDLFILPSLREGQSLVMFEAMMAGLPVIASDLPTISEVIKSNENGILVQKGDVEDLSLVIERTYKNQELRLKLAKNGKETSDRFLEKSHISNLENLFINLFNEK